MSQEKYPNFEPDALHSIDYEVLRHGLIMDEQARLLDEAGVIEKVLDLFRGNDIYRRQNDLAPADLPYERLVDTSNLTMGVYREWRNRGESDEFIVYGVRFELIETIKGGYQTRSRKALVGEQMSGILLPQKNFEFSDLELVISLVQALELEQQVGELPHLDTVSLSRINDPRKMIQKLPPASDKAA